MASQLSRALNEILTKWGHNIYLQRRDTSGKAWTNTLEKHTVRHRYPAVRGLPAILQEREEGIVHDADMLYYFRPEALPREGDRIYEIVDPRYEGFNGRNEGWTTWKVAYSLPMRGRGGEIVYFLVGANRENPN